MGTVCWPVCKRPKRGVKSEEWEVRQDFSNNEAVLPPAQLDDVQMTEEVQEAILVILYMNWGVMELDTKFSRTSKQRVFRWTKYKFNGSFSVIRVTPLSQPNEEIKITPVPSFPLQ